MSDVDTIRSDLFKSEGAFVDKLQDADKTAPALHDEAVVRLNAVFKYASVEGRKRFLEEMKIPGAWREARLVYETCLKGGGTEEECQEAQAKVKTFRPIFEAWPSANTVTMWWSAPITHLIGTYDPNNPPAGEFKGCYYRDFDVKVMNIHSKGRVWNHTKVPINAMIKNESTTNGSKVVFELKEFGTKAEP